MDDVEGGRHAGGGIDLVRRATQLEEVFDLGVLEDFLVHLRGQEHPRPWESAANNPLARWAERKQAEAAAENKAKRE